MIDCKINDFSRKLQGKTGSLLKSLSVELTRKCNFHCRHCFCTNQPSIPEELSFDEWVKIFEQYAKDDGLFITLTGGEALLYKDFVKLWEYLKKRGFILTLFSNASLIDAEFADFFLRWSPLQISVTLYGASNETYERATGCPNMFSRVIEALELLRKRGISLEVKGVFSRLNVDDFEAVRKIALEYCDLFRWDMALMGAFATSENQPKAIRLSPEEYVEVEATEPVRFFHMKKLFQQWNPPDFARKREGAFACNVRSGISMHIDSSGKMHPCVSFEYDGYDLTKGTLREGWHKAIPKFIETFPCQPGPCQNCAVADLCGPCAAFALLEGCSVTGSVPYKCELVKARAVKYGAEKVINYLKLHDNFKEENYGSSSEKEGMDNTNRRENRFGIR